jgi:hypothetical protein
MLLLKLAAAVRRRRDLGTPARGETARTTSEAPATKRS